jgi:hypothetical protein
MFVLNQSFGRVPAASAGAGRNRDNSVDGPGTKVTAMRGSSMSSASRRSGLLRVILEKRSASVYGMVLVFCLGMLGGLQVLPNGVLVTPIFLVVAYEFQKRLDQGVPLLQLTSLIAVLQWLVGPLLNFSSEFQYGRYQMYVSEAVYFEFALPATAAYVVVMMTAGASVRQRNLLQLMDRSSFVTVGVVLNVIGLIAAFAGNRASGGTAFLFHLISQLRYVGAAYFLFSNSPIRLLLAAASLSPLLLTSVSVGMFHDLLLWLAIIFCYWFAQKKWDFRSKIAVLLSATALLFSIQAVKLEYRARKARGVEVSLVGLMVDYLSPGGKAWEDNSLSLVVTRLNQGWIISAIMDHVPAEEPYADGETLKDAVISALMPRILMPDKKTAGGRENFRRFTGLEIADSTSMGISPLGEAYANFGPIGGIVLMAGFGGLFAACFVLAMRFTVTRPSFFFWMPVIFYQAIKAETEFAVVLNQLTKGAIVAIVMYYAIEFNFPTRLRRPVLLQSLPRRRTVGLPAAAGGVPSGSG